MAVTATAAYAGTYMKSWDVVASADGDTAGTITHGFSGTPADVSLLPLRAEAYGSQWVVSSVGTATIVLGKTSAASSGNATAQVRVIARLPHSIVG